MIDGWFMRKRVYKLNKFSYNGKNIRNYCMNFLKKEDFLYRIFYYDTKPLIEKGHNPVTKNFINFSTTSVAIAQDKLFQSIKGTPHFALRLGKTVWKNKEWALRYDKFKDLINKKISIDDLKENDVKPLIMQKAVDMKIGLDIALIAIRKLADLLIIITGDADLVPALKLARREGIQVGLDPLRCRVRPELAEHVDFITSYI